MMTRKTRCQKNHKKNGKREIKTRYITVSKMPFYLIDNYMIIKFSTKFSVCSILCIIYESNAYIITECIKHKYTIHIYV